MGAADRLQARTRLRSGTHVPHPGIAVAQVTATQLEFERPTPRPARRRGRRRGPHRLDPRRTRRPPRRRLTPTEMAVACAPDRRSRCGRGSSTRARASYRWGEIERPAVGPDDVAVRVVASALNHMDLWVTRGRPKPTAAARAGRRRGRRGDRGGGAGHLGGGGRRGGGRPDHLPARGRRRAGHRRTGGQGHPDPGRAPLGRPRRRGGGAGHQRGAPAGRADVGRVRRLPGRPRDRVAAAAPGPGAGRRDRAGGRDRRRGVDRLPGHRPPPRRRGARDVPRPGEGRRRRWPSAPSPPTTRPPSAGTSRPTWSSRASARRPGSSRPPR